MMLSSAGRPQDTARCKALGLCAYLIKPVRQSELLDAITTALRLQPERAPRPARAPEPPRMARRPLRILLAEDHPVNQKLAVRILEKWRHSVTVAGNGLEALKALEREPFDLVLMDVQMPEMGGFEATAAIRERERQGGAGHVPVIAMTAHAMKGDRERCLEAGMDSYVSKPIQAAELFAVIEQTMGSFECEAPGAAPQEVLPASEDGRPVLEREALLQRVQGDWELLGELVDLFLEAYPGQLAGLRAAVERGESPDVSAGAHALRGSVSNFAARRAEDTALALEESGRRGDLTGAHDLLADLEAELQRLGRALCELKAQESGL
jgi:CheY-like chemotaxis protein